jgi:hypothetical protein
MEIDWAGLRRDHPILDTIQRETGQQGRRQGQWVMFFCPMHADGQHPSLGVSLRGDRWKCFGSCDTSGGDSVDFLAWVHQISLGEAARMLTGNPVPEHDLKNWLASQAREEKERQAAIAAKQLEFSQHKPWLAWHDQMTKEQRAWWQSQGIPDDWQDYWKLGWRPRLWDLGPAFTIPFLEGELCRAMQYRLEQVEGRNKYRFEPDLGSSAFIANREMSLKKVIITEGAKKAAVAHIRGTDCKMQVIGTPNQRSDGGICARLSQECEQAWIILDPEAWIKPEKAQKDWVPGPIKIGRMIGGNCRVQIVRFPMKLDDAILSGAVGPTELRQILWNSRTLASYEQEYPLPTK